MLGGAWLELRLRVRLRLYEDSSLTGLQLYFSIRSQERGGGFLMSMYMAARAAGQSTDPPSLV